MSKIMISELQETTSAPDSSYIAIDNGTTTNKITIANYNSNANATAKRYAEASQGYATEAQTAKDDAVSAKNEAETLVNAAASYANASNASANAAAGSASEASGYVGAAQTSASNALASARAAEASAADIDNQVKLAKSWAVGNTGVRADEAVNNSMYWAGQAAAAAGGGVVSFNGRTGSVIPESGDYSSDEIAHVNSDSTYSNVETEINNLQTSRLKTYASDSTQWDSAPTANSTKPVTSGGIKAQFDSIGTQITDINDDIADANAEIADLHTEDSRLSTQISDFENSFNQKLDQKQNLILIESQGKNITGNGYLYREANYNVTKAGYTFIGVGGWSVGNVEYNMNCIKKNGQLYVMAHRLDRAAWSGTLSFAVEIIYQKNS